MKPELKAKWVAALRSGKFEQANGAMKECDEDNKVSFCCLGVLRHLAHPKSTLEDEGEAVLHPRHLKEFGLTNEQQTQLAWMNDGNPSKQIKQHSFKEIARYIEKKL